MTTDNHKISQSEEFVDLTLNRARRSLKNTTIVLWAIFSLLIAYFIGLNYLLVKSTKTAVEIGEAYGVTSNNWKTVKGYIEQLPDIKEDEEWKSKIKPWEDKLNWTNEEGKEKVDEYIGYLKKANDPEYFNSISNKLAKTRNTLKSIAKFDPDKYRTQLEHTQMILDLINEANDTKKLATRISQTVSHELSTQGNIVASYASELLDENLDTLPEWAKAQVPKYSNRLQDKIEIWINQFCVATSDELGSSFDTFLDDHAEKIREFSEAADDETALGQLDEELTVMVSTFMRTTPIKDHGTLEEQSQQFLGRLEAANDMLKPLVQNKREDLTPEQLLLRRTLAIFMKKIDNINLEQ
tara:strand:- start:121 stop:1182 length:1062 start_codon:yes stop_codon:yes gene_type:complete